MGCVGSQNRFQPAPIDGFYLYNKPTKAKVTLAFARLLYGTSITSSRRLVSPVGRGFIVKSSDTMPYASIPLFPCEILFRDVWQFV
jgi:hypothetical protein